MTIGYYLDAWSSTESTGNRSETYRLCCWVPLSLSPQQRRSLNKRKPQVILGIAKTSSLSSSKSPVSLTSINGRARGYRLSPYHFQTVECWLLIGHKKGFTLFCPIGKQHLEFFSYVRTRRLFSRHTCLVRSSRLCMQGKFSFSTLLTRNEGTTDESENISDAISRSVPHQLIHNNTKHFWCPIRS